MPKSRRAKVIPLTKTKPKTRSDKDNLIQNIRDAVEAYQHVYTFRVDNPRTTILQQIREERRGDSRMFMGNNKIMSIAVGRDVDTSIKPNLHKITQFLCGLCGLLFTNLSPRQMKDYLESIGAQVYARSGQVAAQALSIPAGPLTQFPHSMFEHLSKLGLPVRLDKGVIVLLNETTICDEGDTLSAEAAQLLKLFGVPTAEFRLRLTSHWSNGVAKKLGVKAKPAVQEEAD